MNIQRQRAKALRSEMTPPEARLWWRLRVHRLYGLKFKRQVPLGPYIVDFLCEAHGLVIEVDGDTHARQVTYDRRRDAFLNASGYYVLRFTNLDVVQNLDGVLFRIVQACGK